MTRHATRDEKASSRPEPGAGDARRERIVEAAARLFAERGFANVTVRDVAVAAGVTHPLIYYYWSSKDDLLAAAVAHSQGVVRRAGVAEPDPLDAVVAIVRESLEHNRRYLQTLTRAFLDGMPPSEWPGGYPGVEAALARLTAGLEPGGEADTDARERVALVVAMLMGWSLIEDQLLEVVGLPADDRERARAALYASVRQLLGPASPWTGGRAAG